MISETATRKLYEISEVISMIQNGKHLTLAGDERALEQLPKGNWIGGTIPYFMDFDKGQFTQDKIFVNEISPFGLNCSLKTYDELTIHNITRDRYKNGYTLLIIPAFQPIHTEYALNASHYSNLFDAPIIGWISGAKLESTDKPKVYNGQTLEHFTDKGIALHIELPANKMPELEIVNIHKPQLSGDEFEFFEDGFNVTDCLINGEKENLAKYFSEHQVDIKLPLISDFAGAKLNVSIKEINKEKGIVELFAPVFRKQRYKLAMEVRNYEEAFRLSLPELKKPEEFSCNCILNYLYGELEMRQVGMTGPATFGEIAYLLLNQTLVYLTIEEA